MATQRQPSTLVLIRNEKTGSEIARACLGVYRRPDGSVEIQEAEQVFERVEHPAEVLMISERGPCWHRFKTEA
ncbi:MAG: hypothetical protein WD118_11340 [Phycisphaeraceae bacterium]